MVAAIWPTDARGDGVDEARANTEDVGRRMCELAAHTHAAMAELTLLADRFNEADGWCGDGMRSFSAWLTINAGFSPRTGDELLRVGQALRSLPEIRAAFAAGRLSFDAVRELASVATAGDEHLWLDVAAAASGAQLARICRACRRVMDLDTPRHADDQLRRRGVWAHFADDGMLSLRALLLPEEGALVQAAIEAALRANESEQVTPDEHVETAAPRSGAAEVADPADEPWAARRADALVAVCEHVLAKDGDAVLSDPAALPMLVHVDVGALAGHDPDGRRHIEGGPVLSISTIRRLGCDASVIAVTERDGVPINVGRSRRILPRALRRAVQGRDRTCRFPGCAVPAQRSHAHHIEHWADGGATDLDNIVSLCRFHHRRLHDGAFRIERGPAMVLTFTTAGGQPILRRPVGVDAAAPMIEALRTAVGGDGEISIDSETPGTTDGTAQLDLGYVVSVILEAVDRVRQSANEPPMVRDATGELPP